MAVPLYKAGAYVPPPSSTPAWLQGAPQRPQQAAPASPPAASSPQARGIWQSNMVDVGGDYDTKRDMGKWVMDPNANYGEAPVKGATADFDPEGNFTGNWKDEVAGKFYTDPRYLTTEHFKSVGLDKASHADMAWQNVLNARNQLAQNPGAKYAVDDIRPGIEGPNNQSKRARIAKGVWLAVMSSMAGGAAGLAAGAAGAGAGATGSAANTAGTLGQIGQAAQYGNYASKGLQLAGALTGNENMSRIGGYGSAVTGLAGGLTGAFQGADTGNWFHSLKSGYGAYNSGKSLQNQINPQQRPMPQRRMPAPQYTSLQQMYMNQRSPLPPRR